MTNACGLVAMRRTHATLWGNVCVLVSHIWCDAEEPSKAEADLALDGAFVYANAARRSVGALTRRRHAPRRSCAALAQLRRRSAFPGQSNEDRRSQAPDAGGRGRLSADGPACRGSDRPWQGTF